MYKTVKCYKNLALAEVGNRMVLHVGERFYLLTAATMDEIKKGNEFLAAWRVERQYRVQVCGPDSPRPYYDWRSEAVEIPFEELIFSDGECIGIYHEECVLLFGDPKTHRTPKWLGELITGPDSSVDVYDYYLLIQNEL